MIVLLRSGLGAVLLASLALTANAQPTALEEDVKATFVLNFSRYVEWPEPRRIAPFRVCVLGQTPFAARLQATFAGEQWQGAAMRVERVDDVDDARRCHVLYVPAAQTDRFLASASRLAGEAVLTVGETRAFMVDGGVIQLFLETNKVRFSVNLAAAETAGLQVSSRLLRLAREILPSTRAP